MSDGIVVLVTKDPETKKEEYRVNYVPQVDKLIGEFNETTSEYDPNSNYVLDIFTECPIFTDGDLAFGEADRIASKQDHELENGILLMTYFKDREFNTI